MFWCWCLVLPVQVCSFIKVLLISNNGSRRNYLTPVKCHSWISQSGPAWVTWDDKWVLNDFSFGPLRLRRYPNALVHAAMPLHICNVLFSKQLSHRQWQFIFLCLLSFVEYPIQFVIMKCLSWLSGDSSLFHNDRGTWKMLLRLTRGIHRQCFNLHVMSRADLLSTSLPSRPSVVRKAFSGMAVRCICGPSGRGNALGQLYIPWPQAAFVDWFSYTMHNLHNWTSLHMEPTDHKWAFFFSP